MADKQGCALVLEGGGYRGIFTSGVLDVLQERGVYGFSGVWGTSAGALNAACFKSRQIGRSARVVIGFCDDSRMMSVGTLVKTGSIAGNDFLYGEVQNEIDPFDNEVFNANPLPMWAVASDMMFGQAAYLPVNRLPEDLNAIIASASLPVISEEVMIGGKPYLDGGTCDSVAVEAALGELVRPIPNMVHPAARAVVVLTQPRDYRKDAAYALRRMAHQRYAGYPYYLEALDSRPARYNAQREHIFELEAQGKVLVIAPEADLGISTTNNSTETLLRGYIAGRKAAGAALVRVAEFVRAPELSFLSAAEAAEKNGELVRMCEICKRSWSA